MGLALVGLALVGLRVLPATGLVCADRANPQLPRAILLNNATAATAIWAQDQ